MKAIMDTLFYPFRSDLLPSPAVGQSTTFFNAQGAVELNILAESRLYLQQHFKPYALELEAQGYKVHEVFPEQREDLDYALVILPKNVVEARYMVACALVALRVDGFLVVAAENKAGGSRIKKMLQQFGLMRVQEYSKNKARVCWAVKGEVDEDRLREVLEEGAPQKILEGEFISQPGVFGWNKVDQGSQILTEYLPEDLSGHGADFGCGYGFLSAYILGHCMDVEKLYAIDADARAVQMCKVNVLQQFSNSKAEFLWQDLTSLSDERQQILGLDFIVMNPPFHEGKVADSTIGKSFISVAYKALREGGRLYMVANAHLPYERDLAQFSSCIKLYEGQGFKVFVAVK